MELPAEYNELANKGISQEELLDKFKLQLEKDLNMSHTAFHVGALNDLSLNALTHQLSEALQRMPQGSFQELLYRVDLNEHQLFAKTKENKETNPHEVIAQQIIKRVLQKVIFKLIYSKDHDNTKRP